MGYVFDFQDARDYTRWAAQPANQWAARLECDLMLNLLQPAVGESILDIGCGAGNSALPLLNLGMNVTGIDSSPYMLELASDALANRVDLYRGFAEELPFDDNSFNHALFFLCLEFVDDVDKAVEEACRVAKDKVFFGFLNRFALKGLQRWRKSFWGAQVFSQARLFSMWELKRLVRAKAGPVPMAWRTVCQLPHTQARMFNSIESFEILRRCPFGAFAGMVATLVPRFRTRPLAIRYIPKKNTAILRGSVPVGSAVNAKRHHFTDRI
ncbi:MAG: class I SAM-dependent methyltransferase [Desulfatitalea sp.]|nr:class I SAM-dependent methyltransferase [Desulfatitalea sp.]NNK00018.1 class I SAM-dependent methyltransferase [Desulfatitalea sp.]